jgi:hypothetical protein
MVTIPGDRIVCRILPSIACGDDVSLLGGTVGSDLETLDN